MLTTWCGHGAGQRAEDVAADLYLLIAPSHAGTAAPQRERHENLRECAQVTSTAEDLMRPGPAGDTGAQQTLAVQLHGADPADTRRT